MRSPVIFARYDSFVSEMNRNGKEATMDIRELIRNAKISLCVVTGVAAIFGCAFVATTLVAAAAEEEQAGATDPADKQSDESVTEPAPNAPGQAPQPRRPAFARAGACA